MNDDPREWLKHVLEELAALRERVDVLERQQGLKPPSWEDTHRAFVPAARRIAGEG